MPELAQFRGIESIPVYHPIPELRQMPTIVNPMQQAALMQAHANLANSQASALNKQMSVAGQNGPPAQSLSDAYAMHVARRHGQSPTMNAGSQTMLGGHRGQSPMASSISQAKSAARALAAQNNLTDDQNSQLDQLQNNPNVTLPQFEGAMKGLKSPKPKAVDPEKTAKRQEEIAGSETKLVDQYGQGVTQPLDPNAQYDSPDKQAVFLQARNQYKMLADEATGLSKPQGDSQAAPQGHASITPTGQGKPITVDIAHQFYQQAGQNPNKARELAKAAGYVF